MVGNTTNYTEEDILRCFFVLPKNQARQKIAKMLGLGEGSVKAILEILKDKNIISSTRKGHFLTSEGLKILDRALSIVSLPVRLKLGKKLPGEVQVASVLKRPAGKLNVLLLRDEAVRRGAEGAIILTFRKGSLELGFKAKQQFNFLIPYFELEDGNLLLLSFGRSYAECERALISMLIMASPTFRRIASEIVSKE
ncbi:MAG: DUF4443 domain-containing protein [Candidatus Woesearchaeota archaeon]